MKASSKTGQNRDPKAPLAKGGDLKGQLAKDRATALKTVHVSRETLARLDLYVDLLLNWQKITNLVAPSTLPEIWTRHIADSLQLLDLAPDAKIWLDLGSGGGFPGVVLACALAEIPGAHVHLVERNAKKAAFLREALRIAGGPGTVHLADIGDSVDKFVGRVDCVTARALAPLKVLLDFVAPLVSETCFTLLMKGQDIEAELTEASKYWKLIDSERFPSRTNAAASILKVSRLSPR